MTTQLTISAIIPLYNGGKYIREALESVFAQTLPPNEIIVVDDGSTDDGPQIVESMKGNHPLTLLRKSNGGQSSARNHGVRHSTGGLIALLDQDDVWYPNHLEELSKPFLDDHHAPLGWVYSNLDEIDGDGLLVERRFLALQHATHPKRSLGKCLGEDMFILPSASLISREAFDSVGGFDERLSGYEDDDLFLRLFRHGYWNIYLDVALSQWRITGDTCSYTPRMARSRMTYAHKLIETYPNDRRRNRYYVRDLIAPRFLRSILGEYRRTISDGETVQAMNAVNDLKALRRYAGKRLNLMFSLAIPIFRCPQLARIAFGIWPLVRKFI